MFVHFTLQYSSIGKVLSWQELDFDIRISRAISIHGFQITSIKYIDIKRIVDKDHPDRQRTKSDFLVGFKRLLQSIESVLMNQIASVHPMESEQPADLGQKFVFFLCVSVRIVETVFDDIQQFLPLSEAGRLPFFLFF